jgi:mRNA interferase RelE/StbE
LKKLRKKPNQASSELQAVYFTASAKSPVKTSPNQRSRIEEAIRSLAGQPRPPGSKKLSGRDGWRIRMGAYRIIYEIDNKSQ